MLGWNGVSHLCIHILGYVGLERSAQPFHDHHRLPLHKEKVAKYFLRHFRYSMHGIYLLEAYVKSRIMCSTRFLRHRKNQLADKNQSRKGLTIQKLYWINWHFFISTMRIVNNFFKPCVSSIILVYFLFSMGFFGYLKVNFSDQYMNNFPYVTLLEY